MLWTKHMDWTKQNKLLETIHCSKQRKKYNILNFPKKDLLRGDEVKPEKELAMM